MKNTDPQRIPFYALLPRLARAARLIFDRRVPFWVKLVPVFSLVYIFSPIDLIPDVLLGPGQLDDLGIFIAGLTAFESLALPYRQPQKRKNDAPPSGPQPPIPWDDVDEPR